MRKKEWFHFAISCYTILLSLFLAYGILSSNKIDAHSYSLIEQIVQSVILLWNIICFALIPKIGIKSIMLLNIILLSLLQDNLYLAIVFFLFLGLISIIRHVGHMKSVLYGTIITVCVCLLSSWFKYTLGAPFICKEIYSQVLSPNKEYQIIIANEYSLLGKSDSYFECRSNNDINLLVYRIIRNQQCGIFDFAAIDEPVYWISESEFSINGEIYSVNDFPIYIRDE